MEHNFGENQKEYVDGEYYEVVQSPKYLDSKKRVIEMLESGIYKGLSDGHFWILMNKTKTKKMVYSGLIISHDGMKIINDNASQERKVNPRCFKDIKTIGETMYLEYLDDDTYEIGEVSKSNCKNPYPLAMLTKRCYDRVVKSKNKLYGLYSESEADEFKQPNEEVEESIYEVFKKLYSVDEVVRILQHNNVEKVEQLNKQKIMKYIGDRKK